MTTNAHADRTSRFGGLEYCVLLQKFADGTDSPRAFLERCLETISEREDTVKAWVVLNESSARLAADASSSRHRAGRALSSIDGMPIGIKDLIHTKDMPTQLGSPIFKGYESKSDSPCVQALRNAGAVILGKTVTTELGWSHPGPTTNPFDALRTPGGSSSGSGAAIGARMVPAAIGSQVGGSIIRPASYCANYAIKPTLGAINRGEGLPLSQLHTGVHAGSLLDMWQVAIEIATRVGGDPGSPGLFGSAGLHEKIKPARLIVAETMGWSLLDDNTLSAFEQVLGQLRDKGVTILRRSDEPVIEAFETRIAESATITYDICAYEFRPTLETLAEREPDGLSEALKSLLDGARQMSLNNYRAALHKRDEARLWHAALANTGDAMITLSSVGPAPLLQNTGAKDFSPLHTTGSPAFNLATSLLGAPTITMPLLAVDGMPVGIQIIGQQHADHRLTGLARWIGENIQPVSV